MVGGYSPQTAIKRPKSGVTLSVTRKTEAISTDVVLDRMPAIFEWLPVGGDTVDFNISLKFDGHPSGSFSFIARAEDRLLIQEQLAIGKEFEAFGIGWRVANLAFAEAPASKQPARPIAVNVSLGGKHEPYLKQPIPLIKSNIDPTKNIDPDCVGKINGDKKKGLEKTMTVQRLASSAGTSFSGPGSWRFTIPADTNTSTTVTLSSKISELEFSNRAFPFYSDPKKIRAVSPNAVKHWSVEEDIIIGAVTTTINGANLSKGELTPLSTKANFKVVKGTLPPTPLDPTSLPLQVEPPPELVEYFWPRYKLEGEFTQTEEVKKEEESTKGDKPKWKRRAPEIKELIEDADNASEPPGDGYAGDVSQNFDQSGPQKVWKKTKYQDGTEISSEIKIYGYAFLGSNATFWHASRWVTNPVNGEWKVVKYIKTTHEFENEYGFHLGYVTTGWTLQRLKQESSGIPETAIYAGLSGRPLTTEGIGPLLNSVSAGEALELPEGDVTTSLGQIAGLYHFKKIKYIEEEAKYIEPLRRYYRDSEVPFKLEEAEKVCLPNGTSKWVAEQADPYQAPEYFVSLKQVFKSSYLEATNPELTLQNKISKELDFTEAEKQDRAVTPKLITGSIGLEETKTVLDPRDESYTIYKSSYSSQGPSFNKKLQQTTIERVKGRPDTRILRLPSLYSKEEVKDSIKIKKEVKEPEVFEHWVTSSGKFPSSARLAVGGSLNYINCESVRDARNAAEYDLWKRNIKGLGTKTITIQYNKETQLIKEGDIIELTLNNIKGTYRVTGINYALKIHGIHQENSLVTCAGIQLTIAPEPVIKLKYNKSKPMKTESSKSSSKPKALNETQVTVLRDRFRELKFANDVKSRIKPPGKK